MAAPLVKMEEEMEETFDGVSSNIPNINIEEQKAYTVQEMGFTGTIKIKEEPKPEKGVIESVAEIGTDVTVLPDGMCLVKSEATKGEFEDCKGVWTTKFLPKETEFGPYSEGFNIKSSWISSVRIGSPDELCNIETIRTEGQVIYKTLVDIPSEAELIQFNSYTEQSSPNACGKSRICNFCGKSFAIVSHLNRHKLTHTGQKPHKCRQCGQTFTQSGDLQRHEKLHSGNKPHICSDCGRQFAILAYLQKHKRTHSVQGEPPRSLTLDKKFNCPLCGRGFSRKNDMANHILIHTGEKPHQCSKCGRRFSRVCTLNRHILSHADEKDKPFRCPDCPRSFTRHSLLQTHCLKHCRNEEELSDASSNMK